MFHDLACLNQRYGDSERALAHIRAAAGYGDEMIGAKTATYKRRAPGAETMTW